MITTLKTALRRILNRCRYMGKQVLTRLRWLPWELRLRIRGHGPNFRIFTHMNLVEKLLLYRLACKLKPGAVIVEIGSYLGASSTFLAAAAKERKCMVYCVDTWTNEGMSEGFRDAYADFMVNTRRYASQIRALRGTSIEVARTFSKPIDLLFVDGDHSYEGCCADAEAWLPKVKSGGIVVFHDIGWAEGVQRTIQEKVKPLEQSRGHIMGNIYWAQINPQLAQRGKTNDYSEQSKNCCTSCA